jgi:hypothetical protein
LERLAESRDYLGLRPVQIYPEIFLRSSAAGLDHQLWTINPFRELNSVKPVQGPTDWLPIRRDNVKGIESMTMLRI